jgi:hypothetical protein
VVRTPLVSAVLFHLFVAQKTYLFLLGRSWHNYRDCRAGVCVGTLCRVRLLMASAITVCCDAPGAGAGLVDGVPFVGGGVAGA